MRTLKCKSIAPKVSLYVAGDLVGEAEREVAMHLLACEDCSRLSGEFSKSSSLLARASSPPEFGAEFYSGIRSAVLADIASRRPKPSLFRPRWLYATAFAALLIASGIMLQFFVSASRQATHSVAVGPTVTGQPISSPGKEFNLSASAQSGKRSRSLSVPVSRRVPQVSRPDAAEIAQAARNTRPQIGQGVESRANIGPVALESAPAALASAAQVSRIEIQTSNPNIRIIWLQPREPQESEETNRDHDQHQNGTRK
jgi:hypothetical protein